MVDRNHEELSIQRQCELLGVNRSSYYYQAKEVSSEEFTLLKLLDEQYLKTPFYGSQKMAEYLKSLGYCINRKRVIRLRNKLGLQTIYPKPKTTMRNPDHQVYPYLLREVEVEKANQVWCSDITYLPIGKGHYYLVAIMDWYSRKVLSWRISNTMDVHFCQSALEEALYNYGKPDIFNSDQESQFTSKVFTDCLKRENILLAKFEARGRKN